MLLIGTPAPAVIYKGFKGPPAEFLTAYFSGAVTFGANTILQGRTGLNPDGTFDLRTFSCGVISFWFADNRGSVDTSAWRKGRLQVGGNVDSDTDTLVVGTPLTPPDFNDSVFGLTSGTTTGLPGNQSFTTQPGRNTVLLVGSETVSGLSISVTVGGLNASFPFDFLSYGTFTFNYGSVIFAETGVFPSVTDMFRPTGESIGGVPNDAVSFGGGMEMSNVPPPFPPDTLDTLADQNCRFNAFQRGSNAPAGILETVGSVCLSLLGPSSLSRPNNLKLVLFDQNGTQLTNVNADIFPVEDQTIWRNAVVSFDASVPRVQMAVDGQIILDVSTGTAGVLEDLEPTFAMHAPVNLPIDMAYFYYGVGNSFYDLTVSGNLDKFITSSLTAPSLGKSGSNVPNLKCEVMHTGNAVNIFGDAQFAINAVDGSIWTGQGSLVNAPTVPTSA